MSEPTKAPISLFEGVPDDGSATLSFTGRGAHLAAAGAVRFTGGKVYRCTPRAKAGPDGTTIYETVRTLVMIVLPVPPAPVAPEVPTVDL